jgi:hypothetical protein
MCVEHLWLGAKWRVSFAHVPRLPRLRSVTGHMTCSREAIQFLQLHETVREATFHVLSIENLVEVSFARARCLRDSSFAHYATGKLLGSDACTFHCCGTEAILKVGNVCPDIVAMQNLMVERDGLVTLSCENIHSTPDLFELTL